MPSSNPIIAEKAAGRKAGQALKKALKNQLAPLGTTGGKDTIHKPGYRVRFRNFQLQSVSVRTKRHAFVHHFGVGPSTQSGGTRKANTTKNGLVRRAHPFRLPKRVNIHIPDNIINELADRVTEARGDNVLTEIGKQWQVKA